MPQKKVQAARVAFFESGRYMRGDGEYQKLFNELKEGAKNPKFIWLYEIYYLWHTQRVFMGVGSIIKRGQNTGVNPNFAKQVACSIEEACKKFTNLASGLALDKDALLDVCLNEEHYHAVCMQIIPAATQLLNALDEFMDTMLFHLRDEITIMDTLPSLPSLSFPKPSCRSSSSNASSVDNDIIDEPIRRHSSDEDMYELPKPKSPRGFSLTRFYRRLSNTPSPKSRAQSPTLGTSPK